MAPPTAAAPVDPGTRVSVEVATNADLTPLRNDLMTAVDEDRGYAEMMLDLTLDSLRRAAMCDTRARQAFGILKSGQRAAAIAALEALARAYEPRDKDGASSAWEAVGFLVVFEDAAAAEPFFRRALDLVPDDADARYGVALGEIAAGRTAEAVESLKIVLARSAHEPSPFYSYWARLKLLRLHIVDGDIGGNEDEFVALQTLIESLIAKSPAYRPWERDLAQAMNVQAAAFDKVRDDDSAIATHRAALAIQEKLLASWPDNAQWQSDVVNSDRWIAFHLIEAGDKAGALATFQDAMAILRGADDKLRANPVLRRERGKTAETMALLLIDARQFAAAHNALLEAIQDSEWIGQEAPEQAGWADELAWREKMIAELDAHKLKDLRSALGSYQKLTRLLTWMVRDAPHDLDRGLALAAAYRRLAAVEDATNHGEQAVEAYGNALKTDKRLAEANPASLKVQADLALTLDAIGAIQKALDNDAIAAQAYAEAQAVRRAMASLQSVRSPAQEAAAH